ncbi:MAG TPA: PIN domain-containing protein [Anaerolineales bacterium]|nr:PIN domain-containing protein [Anaerolineales bacterium]
MEKIFVDTSAFFALVNRSDENYKQALLAWKEMIKRSATLITNNYVVVECFSLLQSRLGIDAAREFRTKILPLLQIEWIGAQEHSAIVNFVLSANRRQLSLVDCSCFETMRRMNIEKAFTFDSHFREQGFEIIP